MTEDATPKRKRARQPNTTTDGRIACAFGEYWLGPHPICRAHTADVCGVPIEDVLLPDFSAYAPKLLGPMATDDDDWSLT